LGKDNKVKRVKGERFQETNRVLFIQELEQNYDGLAASLQGLSMLEQKMDKPLKKFAEATDTYAESLKEMVYIKYNR
jgi:hypothetical protein